MSRHAHVPLAEAMLGAIHDSGLTDVRDVLHALACVGGEVVAATDDCDRALAYLSRVTAAMAGLAAQEIIDEAMGEMGALVGATVGVS